MPYETNLNFWQVFMISINLLRENNCVPVYFVIDSQYQLA